MDKITPKPADVFQDNRDRAAPLLAKLKAEGIGHIIDGKTAPSISGETFETKSPVDNAVLASVARGNAEDIDRAATAAALAFKAWRDMPARCAKNCCIGSPMPSRIAPTISPCWNASTPARRIASWPRPRFAPLKISASSPTNARTPATASILPSDEHWNVSTRVPIGRSA